MHCVNCYLFSLPNRFICHYMFTSFQSLILEPGFCGRREAWATAAFLQIGGRQRIWRGGVCPEKVPWGPAWFQSNSERLWLDLPLPGGRRKWIFGNELYLLQLCLHQHVDLKGTDLGKFERFPTYKDWLKGQEDLSRGDHQRSRLALDCRLEKQPCSGWVNCRQGSSVEELQGVCTNTDKTIDHSNSTSLTPLCSLSVSDPGAIKWMKRRWGTGKREVISHSCISDFQPRYGEGREERASKRISFRIFTLLDEAFKIIEWDCSCD